jgi:signal transduction histidine kinase/HAMP domain-containing protein
VLKNMKIGTRLSLGFGVILFLLLVLGAFAINRMQAVDHDLQTLVHDKWSKVLILDEIRKQNDVVALAFLKQLLTDDTQTRQNELDRVMKARTTITKQLDILQGIVTSDEGKRLLENVIETRTAYLNQQLRTAELAQTGNREQARGLLLGELAQAQSAYVEAVNTLSRHQDTYVDQLVTLADATYHFSLQLIPALLAGITLLVILIAWFITRSITKPLAACVTAANRIARGDTTVHLDDTAKDETGILQGAMIQMVNSITSLISDADTLAHAAVAGRLGSRADISRHQGGFQQIMQGFNETLNAVIGPLNVAAEYVDRISKGDIPPPITDTYHGDFNEIKCNINHCLDIMNNLLSETNGVLAAAAEGRLDQRADANLFIGDWRQLVLGVNDIVTEIVNPLRHTTDLLNQEITQRSQIQESLQQKQLQLEELNSELELRVAIEVKKNQQRYQLLMQNEKMASLGQLAAGVAHEINNPVGYVASNLRILDNYFGHLVKYDRIREEEGSSNRGASENIRKSLDIQSILEDGPDLIRESLDGAERVANIVQDLKGFSRKDAPLHEPVNLISCMESALNICNNELKYVATIRKEYDPVPEVLGNHGQLNQVFLNLLVNAGHAIVPMGEIVLKNWHDDTTVYASVSDTGLGIPKELLDRIFEPFFTTKEEGKGTGLGLSISHEIIKQHNGELLVESVMEKGTTFTVALPLIKNED